MDKFGCLLFIIFALYFIRGEWQNDQEKWNIEKVLTENHQLETALIKTQHKVRLLDDGSQWLTKALDVNKDHDFNMISSYVEPTGNKTHFYQQSYKGYPVENSFFQITSRNGFIKTASGFHFPELNFRPIVSISEKNALDKVLASNIVNVGFINEPRHPLVDPEASLVITQNYSEQEYSLCYKFTFTIDKGWEEPVFVDAESGEIITTQKETLVASFDQLASLIALNNSTDFNEKDGNSFMDPTLENPQCCMPERGLFANNTVVFSHEDTIWDEEELQVVAYEQSDFPKMQKINTSIAYLENDNLIGLGNNPVPSFGGEYVVNNEFAFNANDVRKGTFSKMSFANRNVNTEQFSKRLLTTDSYSGEGIFVILVIQEAGISVNKNLNHGLLLT